jgi:hypothetical protein
MSCSPPLATSSVLSPDHCSPFCLLPAFTVLPDESPYQSSTNNVQPPSHAAQNLPLGATAAAPWDVHSDEGAMASDIYNELLDPMQGQAGKKPVPAAVAAAAAGRQQGSRGDASPPASSATTAMMMMPPIVHASSPQASDAAPAAAATSAAAEPLRDLGEEEEGELASDIYAELVEEHIYSPPSSPCKRSNSGRHSIDSVMTCNDHWPDHISLSGLTSVSDDERDARLQQQAAAKVAAVLTAATTTQKGQQQQHRHQHQHQQLEEPAGGSPTSQFSPGSAPGDGGDPGFFMHQPSLPAFGAARTPFADGFGAAPGAAGEHNGAGVTDGGGFGSRVFSSEGHGGFGSKVFSSGMLQGFGSRVMSLGHMSAVATAGKVTLHDADVVSGGAPEGLSRRGSWGFFRQPSHADMWAAASRPQLEQVREQEVLGSPGQEGQEQQEQQQARSQEQPQQQMQRRSQQLQETWDCEDLILREVEEELRQQEAQRQQQQQPSRQWNSQQGMPQQQAQQQRQQQQSSQQRQGSDAGAALDSEDLILQAVELELQQEQQLGRLQAGSRAAQGQKQKQKQKQPLRRQELPVEDDSDLEDLILQQVEQELQQQEEQQQQQVELEPARAARPPPSPAQSSSAPAASATSVPLAAGPRTSSQLTYNTGSTGSSQMQPVPWPAPMPELLRLRPLHQLHVHSSACSAATCSIPSGPCPPSRPAPAPSAPPPSDHPSSAHTTAAVATPSLDPQPHMPAFIPLLGQPSSATAMPPLPAPHTAPAHSAPAHAEITINAHGPGSLHTALAAHKGLAAHGAAQHAQHRAMLQQRPSIDGGSSILSYVSSMTAGTMVTTRRRRLQRLPDPTEAMSSVMSMVSNVSSILVPPKDQTTIFEHSVDSQPSFELRELPPSSYAFLALNVVMIAALLAAAAVDFYVKTGRIG